MCECENNLLLVLFCEGENKVKKIQKVVFLNVN